MAQPKPRLADLMASLSLAMDLGLGQPFEWVLRCCLTGVRLSEAMGLDDDQRRDVYYLSLLRHLGCTSTSSELAGAFGNELMGPRVMLVDETRPTDAIRLLASMGRGQSPAKRVGSLRRAAAGPSRRVIDATQCDVACRLAAGLGFGPDLVGSLRQTFERWDGKGVPEGLHGEELELPVRVAHVAQDLVAWGVALGPEEARQAVRKRAGRLLDPGIVDLVDQIEPPLGDDDPLWDEVLSVEPKPPLMIEDLEAALVAVADFTDLKSPYFLGHSRKVSELGASSGRRLGLSSEECRRIGRAGLVHDVGRVGVSSAVWDKAQALNDSEMERVRLHPYYTERILSRSGALDDLAEIACSHHECLNGGGYHRGVKGAALPMAARVLAAADDCAALTEPRAHRPAFELEQAERILRHLVAEGCLDGDATQAVLDEAMHRPSRARTGVGGLSDREIEILRLAARGKTIRQMAEDLIISRKTVDRHLQNVYAKIGVSNRAAAALFTLEHGLL